MTSPAAAKTTAKTTKLPRRSQPKDARRFARLVAVQALYQADLMQQSAVLVLKEFESHRLSLHNGHQYLFDTESGDVLGTVEVTLMRDIVALTLQHQAALSEMLSANLPGDWKLERIERPLRVILLAGIAEIMYQPQTALPVIISDYVDVSHAYFGGKEPGMVNAILDKLGKTLRS